MNDNAWFVGVAPRRNPDIVVAILWENGKEGFLSARLAARVIAAYVNKQRRLENNLVAKVPDKVEVGALWSNPADPNALGGKQVQPNNPSQAAMRGGRFEVPVSSPVASAQIP
jgi:penicillin-binding protein 2